MKQKKIRPIKEVYLNRKIRYDNHCIDCGKLIWKNKSMKCQSCLHIGTVCGWNHTGIKPNVGRKHRPETIEKMKLAIQIRKERDGYVITPEQRELMNQTRNRLLNEGIIQPWNKGKVGVQTAWNKGVPCSDITKQKLSKAHTGRKLSEERIQQIKDIARDNPNFGMKGKHHSEETLKKISGENNYNWQGGKSFEPYTLDFNKRFKKAIRERDGCCMLCNIGFDDLQLLKRRSCVHHINYNKLNSFPQNCLVLCNKCHTSTNTNRKQWTVFFQSLLKERYGYEYSEDQKIILDFTKGEL